MDSTSGMFLPVFFSTILTTSSTISAIFEKSDHHTASIASFIAFSILDLSKSTIDPFLFFTLNIAILYLNY